MSALLSGLQVLRELMFAADDAFVKEVTLRFRDEYLRLFEKDKREYINKVFDDQILSNQEIATLLGYSSRSAINAIRDGTIAHDKFELLVATLGSKVQWPAAAERKGQCMVEVIRFVRESLMKKPPTMIPFDEEGFVCLEQAFCESLQLREYEVEGEAEAWLKHVFRRVRAVAETSRITTEVEFQLLMKEWGAAYAKTKNALGFMLREQL